MYIIHNDELLQLLCRMLCSAATDELSGWFGISLSLVSVCFWRLWLYWPACVWCCGRNGVFAEQQPESVSEETSLTQHRADQSANIHRSSEIGRGTQQIGSAGFDCLKDSVKPQPSSERCVVNVIMIRGHRQQKWKNTTATEAKQVERIRRFSAHKSLD